MQLVSTSTSRHDSAFIGTSIPDAYVLVALIYRIIQSKVNWEISVLLECLSSSLCVDALVASTLSLRPSLLSGLGELSAGFSDIVNSIYLFFDALSPPPSFLQEVRRSPVRLALTMIRVIFHGESRRLHSFTISCEDKADDDLAPLCTCLLFAAIHSSAVSSMHHAIGMSFSLSLLRQCGMWLFEAMLSPNRPRHIHTALREMESCLVPNCISERLRHRFYESVIRLFVQIPRQRLRDCVFSDSTVSAIRCLERYVETLENVPLTSKQVDGDAVSIDEELRRGISVELPVRARLMLKEFPSEGLEKNEVNQGKTESQKNKDSTLLEYASNPRKRPRSQLRLSASRLSQRSR